MGEQLFLERFFWFDGEIREGRYPNASTLALRFELSPKTAQRSIEYFRDRMQVPVEYENSRKGYYYRHAYHLPQQRLSESELLALLVSKKLLTDAAAGPLGAELTQLAYKLGNVIASTLPGKVDPEKAFSFRWNGFSPSDQVHFRLVSTALLQARPLSIHYLSPQKDDSTDRTVEPHHMVNYMGTWHLVAYCRLRREWRDFVISRMLRCEMGDEPFEPRPEEEWRPWLEETFGIFQNRVRHMVRLRFSPERSRWVRGQVWHRDQLTEECRDGSLILTIPVSHPAEIVMDILRHGAQVEVLEPDWLRESIRNEIEEMKKMYDL